MADKPDKGEGLILGLASSEDFGAMLRGAGVALSLQDADLRYLGAVNPTFLFADVAFIGRSDGEIFPAAASEMLIACKRRVAETGAGESLDIPLMRDGSTRWYRLWLEPISANGSGRGILCTSIEVTTEKTAAEDLRLALLELAHRSKNLLAVVLSIARQSAEESQTLRQFGDRFVGRIQSLALAHDALTDENWRGATVFNLVRSQVSAFIGTAAAQSTVRGHNAYLKPNAVQYVGLALHELVAVSAVSGALSVPDGQVEVATALAPAGAGQEEGLDLVLTWTETGLPPARKDKSLFGHALLERIVPAALGGRASLTLPRSDTLVYRLSIPPSQYFD
jgi:two-component sensor histidine kinase